MALPHKQNSLAAAAADHLKEGYYDYRPDKIEASETLYRVETKTDRPNFASKGKPWLVEDGYAEVNKFVADRLIKHWQDADFEWRLVEIKKTEKVVKQHKPTKK